jgi:hypothetical protein
MLTSLGYRLFMILLLSQSSVFTIILNTRAPVATDLSVALITALDRAIVLNSLF